MYFNVNQIGLIISDSMIGFAFLKVASNISWCDWQKASENKSPYNPQSFKSQSNGIHWKSKELMNSKDALVLLASFTQFRPAIVQSKLLRLCPIPGAVVFLFFGG